MLYASGGVVYTVGMETNRPRSEQTTLGPDLMRLLEAEVDARTPFGVDFAHAVNAGDYDSINALMGKFADEIVRQYRAKKQ